MSQRILVALFTLLIVAAWGCERGAITAPDVRPPHALPPLPAEVERIAFGSCARQDLDQPVWDAVIESDPDVLVMLGDNIYADTEDMAVLRRKYARFAAVPGFAEVRRTIPMLATWDDHDYGANDAGAEYPMKQASQQIMLDFFGEPNDSTRRRTPGVYDAVVVGSPGRRVQFVLLDTRYFRSPLVPLSDAERRRSGGRYRPTDDPNATLLGEAQWRWLRDQLRKPAELRIIASSIQFVAKEHNWESWSRFGHERQRMIDLIVETGANGVVFISGDRHAAEISRLDVDTPYPLYDVTASSFTHSLSPRPEPNPWRVGDRSFAENFGLITIDWSKPERPIMMQIRDEAGSVQIEHTITRSQITVGEL